MDSVQPGIRTIVRHLADGVAAMTVDGYSPVGRVPLPPKRLRAGGEHFRGDSEFVASGRNEARWLANQGLLTPVSSLLDFGCGVGRLAIGLLEEGTPLKNYVGVDVRRSVVRWARRRITRGDSRFGFVCVDIGNARYNPRGLPFQEQQLPFGDAAFDIAYSYSVFSHLEIDDSRSALRELRRLVRVGSMVIITAFVEDEVKGGVVVNPTEYGEFPWHGPLHCVLYERQMFDGLVREAGFEVAQTMYRSETEEQSRYVLRAA